MPDLTEHPLRIGWGAADATPPKPVIITGQFHARISERVNDPITVTALALEAGDEQAVIVSCDVVAIPREFYERVRDGIRGRAPDLNVSKLFISGIHSHTAPEIRRDKWPELGLDVMSEHDTILFLVDRIVEAVGQAWENRKPGAVGWGLGQAVVGHNRRWTNFEGASTMYGLRDQAEFSHVEGYEDHGVGMLFTWDEKQELTGMVLNVACPAQVSENEWYLSADYWHEVRLEVRRRHGGHLFILPQCAPAGDQSPHHLFRSRAEQRMWELKGVTEREEIGLRIADAVDTVLPAVQKDIRTDVPLAHLVGTVKLTRRRVTDQERDEAEKMMQAHQQKYDELVAAGSKDMRELTRNYRRARWYGQAVERHGLQKTDSKYPMELHVVRLGDVAFATSDFELYLDYGVRIHVRSKAEQNFLVQLAGPGQYLPTRRAAEAGSYGAVPMSTPVGPEGGQEIVEATVRAINSLWPE